MPVSFHYISLVFWYHDVILASGRPRNLPAAAAAAAMHCCLHDTVSRAYAVVFFVLS